MNQRMHAAAIDESGPPGVQEGEVILVHGEAGGVGTMFTQLAVRAGAAVVGTASVADHEHLRTADRLGWLAGRVADGELSVHGRGTVVLAIGAVQ